MIRNLAAVRVMGIRLLETIRIPSIAMPITGMSSILMKPSRI